ncbi:RHS repeat protein, partial [Xanthomonas euvesicatoria]
MNKVKFFVCIVLLLICHVSQAAWTVRGIDEEGRTIPEKTFKTKSEAEIYLRASARYFDYYTDVQATSQNGKIQYSYSSGEFPSSKTDWLYWNNRTTPLGTLYPSGLGKSESAEIAALNAWYPSFRDSCNGTGIEAISSQMRGGSGGEIRPDDWVLSRRTDIESWSKVVTFWFFVRDQNNVCNMRLISQDAAISGMRIKYCPSEVQFFLGEGCGYPGWGTITGDIETCHTSDCREMVGNPIHVFSGEKFYAQKEAVLEGIEFKRTFSSNSKNPHKFATQNWMDNFSSRLYGWAAYLSPEAKLCQVVFQGGNAVCANNESIRFVTVGGKKQVRTSDKFVETFDQDGYLIKVEYLSGQVVEVERGADKKIEKLRFGSGRVINFNYTNPSANAAPLVSSIVFPDFTITYVHDERLRLRQIRYSTGEVISYQYEDPRFPTLLTTVVGEDGKTSAQYVYDNNGRAVTSVSEGRAYQVSYDDAASVSTVTDPNGAISKYYGSIQTFGRVVPQSQGVSEEAWSYGTNGPSSFSKGQWKVDYKRDFMSGVITELSESLKGTLYRRRVVTWNALSPVQDSYSILNASGVTLQKNEFTRNELGQVQTATTTSTQGNLTRQVVSSYCLPSDVSAGTCTRAWALRSKNGPRTDVNDQMLYAYYMADAAGCASAASGCIYRKGDLLKTTNPAGQTTEYLAYDGAGRPLSIKDANGIVTDYSYHPRGWLTAAKVRGADASSEADDRITRIDYWPTGLVRQVTQPDGAFTAFTYDAAHRLTDITDNAGNTVHYTLDNAGNRVKEDTKDAAGTLKRTLSRVYNQLGQLKTQATAASDPTDFAYDANGNATTVTDALATATQSEYDPLNRLSRTLQDVAGIKADTKFEYDALDNLTKVTDPKGLDTTYDYNGFGELVKLTSPDTGVTSYTYDSAGNRATQTDARGNTTAYSYDALNRLTKVTHPTTSLNVTYTYDVTQTACASGETFSIGRLTKMQDGGAITQYCYNRFGDLVRKVQTSNGTALVLRYDYTVGGQLRRMTYPNGAVVDYVRNAQGQTTQIGVTPAGGSRQVLLGNASYYPFGPAAGWTYGNGRTLARQYDLDYRPQAIQDTRPGGLDVGFGFDPAGNLTALTPAGNPAPEIGLGYDALGRLTGLTDGVTGTVIDGYSYDATGNRLSAKVGTTTQIYSYPTDSHRLSAMAGVARTYDATGNTTAIGGTARQYTYDTTGRMTQARRAGAVTMNYRYNGKGEQVRRFLGTTNTYTLFDEAGHWLGDYDSNGAPKQQAIWLDDLPVGLLANANKLHYIEPDHLGSPRVVIDPTRDVAVWTWSLKGEAFGNTA